MDNQQICICGGGSLGHVVAGFIAATSKWKVNILTRRPNQWSHDLVIDDVNGNAFRGKLNILSDDPRKAIEGSDIVLLCLPGFSIQEELEKIQKYVTEDIFVGSIVSSTGFFFFAHEIMPNQKVFGFQRVPFIARVKEYGKSANLLGYKSDLNLDIENCTDKESFRSTIESLFKTPTHLLNNYYEASLTNSNPLLHTSRLYGMLKDWKNGMSYDQQPYFYRDWRNEDSELLIKMDEEFMNLLSLLPVDKTKIPSILSYYESNDAASLTNKIRSITAFKNILSPMIKENSKYKPDFNSRYFLEDFPYGLSIIHRLCHEKGMHTPYIDQVFQWGISMVQQNQHPS